MKNKAYNLATYTFSNGEQLLLDANVWLYLFSAPSDTLPGYVSKYSAAFKQMLSAGAGLALEPLSLASTLIAIAVSNGARCIRPHTLSSRIFVNRLLIPRSDRVPRFMRAISLSFAPGMTIRSQPVM